MNLLNLIFRSVGYFFIFLYELIKANFQIAVLVLSPRFKFKSAAVRIHSKMKSNAELILITNSITLTPGTLVMDADLSSGHILVHVMSVESTDQIRRELNVFPESKVLWLTRGKA